MQIETGTRSLGHLARTRQTRDTGPLGPWIVETGPQVAEGSQQHQQPLPVIFVQLLVQSTLVYALGKKLRDVAARIVDHLPLLHRFPAKGFVARHQRAAIGVYEDLQSDVQLLAVAQHGFVNRGNAGGAGVKVAVRTGVLGGLFRTIHELDGGSIAHGPVTAAGACPGLQNSAVKSGFAQLVGGYESGDSSAQDDDLHAFARSHRQVDHRSGGAHAR